MLAWSEVAMQAWHAADSDRRSISNRHRRTSRVRCTRLYVFRWLRVNYMRSSSPEITVRILAACRSRTSSARPCAAASALYEAQSSSAGPPRPMLAER